MSARRGSVEWQRTWLEAARATLEARGHLHLAALVLPGLAGQGPPAENLYRHQVAVGAVGAVRGDTEDPAFRRRAKAWDGYRAWVAAGCRDDDEEGE